MTQFKIRKYVKIRDSHERKIGWKLASRAPRTREEIRPLWASPPPPSILPARRGRKILFFDPSSCLPLHSLPGGESTPENREALARNQATTRLETNPRARRRVERKLHPNRINRGVLAAVDARPSRNASSFCHDFRSNASFFLFSSFRQCDDEIEACHFFSINGGKINKITINEGVPQDDNEGKRVHRVSLTGLFSMVEWNRLKIKFFRCIGQDTKVATY